MTDTIGTATYEVGLDRSKLATDLAAAGKDVERVGAATEKSFTASGQRSSAAISTAAKAGLVVVSGAAAGALGLATKGALEYQAASGKVQAATGMSAKAADGYVKSLNGIVGSSGTVGKSFEQIADTGSEVAKQLGLTDEAGAKATDSFFKFAKTTGQDATGAVQGFDAALDAFHEPAERATGLMDQLVASNQKYGTDAGPAAQDALAKMAPALTAMNLGLDDGVGLLNLFESAGIDASNGQKLLNTALEALPDGQNINDVIAKLGGIPDPADRATAATDLFGKALGPKLANAIEPGMTSLDSFIIKQGDVVGKNDEASESLMTTGEKFQAMADEAMGALRDVGGSFGPLLTGIGSVGSALGPVAPKLIVGLKDLVPKLLPDAIKAGAAIGVAEGEATAGAATGSKVLSSWLTKFGLMTATKVGAAEAAGLAEGLAEGEAAAGAAAGPGIIGKFKIGGGLMGAGMKLGLLGVVAAIAAEVGPPIGKAGEDLGRKLFGGIAGAFGNTEAQGILHGTIVDSLTDGIHSAIEGWDDSALGRLNFWDHEHGLFYMRPPKAQQIADETTGAIINHIASERLENAGVSFGEKTAAKTAAAYSASEKWAFAGAAAARTTSGGFAVSPEWLAASRLAAAKLTGAFNDRVLSERGQAEDAWSAFFKMMNKPINTAEELADLKGNLTSKKYLAGLASKDPQVRAWAENIRDTTEARINDLTAMLAQDGSESSAAWKNNLNNSYPAAIAEAKAVASGVNRWLRSIDKDVTVNINVNDPTGQGSTAHGHGHAAGGFAPKGDIAWLGEEGPELGYFGKDARIMSNRDLRWTVEKMLGGGSRRLSKGFGGSRRFTDPVIVGMPRSHDDVGSTVIVEDHRTVNLNVGTLVADRAGLYQLGQKIKEVTSFQEWSRMPLGGFTG